MSKRIYLGTYQEIVGKASPVRPVTEGRTDRLIMRDLFRATGVVPPPWAEVRAALMRAGEAHRGDLSRVGWVLPGVVDAVAALAETGVVTQGLLTGNIRANAMVKLSAFGLNALFDFDLGAYGDDHDDRSRLVDIARHRVTRKLGHEFPSRHTVLIGDTPRDIEAARSNGAGIIAVASGVDSMIELAEAGADIVLPSLADSERLVEAVLYGR